MNKLALLSNSRSFDEISYRFPHFIHPSNQILMVDSKVVNLGSDTFGNPIFQKILQNLTKLAILPDYKSLGMLLL